MGYHPRFAIWAIGGESDAQTLDLARRALFHLCIALCQVNYDYLRAFPETPGIYRSRVRYHDDSHLDCWRGTCRIQEDEWQDVRTTLDNMYGDCEDLACIIVSEYWIKGINALPFPVLQNGDKGDESQLWHIQVLLPDGAIEDPSVRLGMTTGTGKGA